MSDADILMSAQQILEENEDIFAAIVENLQLGRMDECIKHYSVLHRNVVSMSQALDNYPTSVKDPHDTVKLFPDDIMRKDVLDELQPPGQTAVPKAPPQPPCSRCAASKFTAYKCRYELMHIEPNAQFTFNERTEFLQVAQLLEQKDRQQKSEYRKAHKPKRNYQTWSSSERYLLLLGIAIYGSKAYENISKLFEDRTTSQVRSFIGKRLTAEDIAKASAKDLPEPPEDFRFPKRLGEVVDAYGKFTDDVMTGKIDLSTLTSVPADGLFEKAAAEAPNQSYSSSVIAPRSGPFDWASLLGIASSSVDAAGSAAATRYGSSGSVDTNVSSASTAPKIPTLTNMLLMQPPVPTETASVAAESAPKKKNHSVASGSASQRGSKVKKSSSSSSRKASKLSKAVQPNREGDDIIIAPAHRRNKSTADFADEDDETNSPVAGYLSAAGPEKVKVKRSASSSAKGSKSKSSANTAMEKSSGASSLSWTPWAASSGADGNGGFRSPNAQQHNRFLSVSNQYGVENSMAMLPDSYSNFSAPPISPSQISNIMYLPGDNENSLALLPLDFSMSSIPEK